MYVYLVILCALGRVNQRNSRYQHIRRRLHAVNGVQKRLGSSDAGRSITTDGSVGVVEEEEVVCARH